MRLDGKVALLTGAAGSIGLAAARRFVAEGAKVMLVDRNEQALQELVRELGSSAAWLAVDVTEAEGVQAMVGETLQQFGGLDILLANAGIEGDVGAIVDVDVNAFDAVMATNVRSVWLGLKYSIPVMRERGGGSIVITSSVAGVQGSLGLALYNTSKHAVVGLMRSAAYECAKYNIRVNTVNPGPIESRMMNSIEDGVTSGRAEKYKNAVLRTTPMARYGQPEEVANMMLFLASDESSYCTGGVYMVDGGKTA